MTIDFTIGDDLNDLLGTPAAQRELPADETFARIRETVPTFTETCPSCRGTGRFVSYSGRPLGQCFKCKGAGKRTFKTSQETRMNNRAKAAERKERTAETNWTDFAERNPEMAAFMLAEATKQITSANERWLDMVRDFVAAVKRYGQLTQGQQGVMERAMARRAERATQRAETARQSESFTFANLQAAFDAVRQRGAKKAQITIGELNISLAAGNGRNPGALYVKVRGEYMGKIAADGRWFPGRDAHALIGTELAKIDADPQTAIKADALARARKIAEAELAGEQIEVPCGCCGILLTDPVSRERGIGPICAGKWGF